jgi:hypothetical protein
MLKKSVNFGLNTSLFLAFFAAVFSFGLHKDWSENTLYSTAVFLSILGIYNFHRWYKFQQKQVHPSLEEWVKNNKRFIQFLSFFGLISSSFLFLYLLQSEIRLLIILVVLFAISLFYVLLKVREIPFLKAPLVALIWTYVLVILPCTLQKNYETTNWYFLLLFYALTIPADARDREIDETKLKTLPQLIGKKASYLMTIILLELFILSQNLFHNNLILIVILLPIIVVFFFGLKNNYKLRVEWFDGLLLLFGLVLLNL